ncbi:MAG: hypothetical protein IKL25_00425 [Clostridia bacterium]|nr:hypothetical protein [Clostridia bacterium]
MTTPMRNRMRSHTRPADFVSKSRQAESRSSCRPGGRSFSFTGEFPDIADQQPVEVSSRRRNYMGGNHTGSYQAVRQDHTARMPAVNKYGVSFVAAMGMLAVVLVLMGAVLWSQVQEMTRIQTSITAKQARIGELNVDCAQTQAAIDAQSEDVNILQEAVRMGLINSQGVKVIYLDPPQDAVITTADQGAVQTMASIWGK